MMDAPPRDSMPPQFPWTVQQPTTKRHAKTGSLARQFPPVLTALSTPQRRAAAGKNGADPQAHVLPARPASSPPRTRTRRRVHVLEAAGMSPAQPPLIMPPSIKDIDPRVDDYFAAMERSMKQAFAANVEQASSPPRHCSRRRRRTQRRRSRSRRSRPRRRRSKPVSRSQWRSHHPLGSSPCGLGC